MSYQAAIDALFAMTPELFTRPGERRPKFSLDQMRTLLVALGNPERAFPAVLIAGTNGKGSTASTLASILEASSLRVGLYTSPHLERVNERIRICGREIADEDFARIYYRVRAAAEALVAAGKLEHLPSFFEQITAIAFCAFAELPVQVAVLEVGLGGRLDATNVVDPLVSVITDISLDHTEWLGPDIASIAREKAGILRPHGILVTLPQIPQANQVFGEIAMELGVRGSSATRYMPAIGADPISYTLEVLGQPIQVQSPLVGSHQQRNIALAITAAIELAAQGFPVTSASIKSGIRNTRWAGRLERITAQGHQWILDVAHNPAGAWALRAGLKLLLDDPKVLVFSCLKDKPLEEMAQILFPLFERIIFAPIHSARATDLELFQSLAARHQLSASIAQSIPEALAEARDVAGDTPVVVSGSVYLVGEVRAFLSAQGS